MTQDDARPEHDGSFGTAAGEAPHDTEVEETPAAQAAGGSDSDDGHETPEELAASDMVEEGGPATPTRPEDLSPADQADFYKFALVEMTNDLQRLQAEFMNYKRRVERDRDLVRENATYAALLPIVDVLDSIDRAREHGDLDPGFVAVADQLERVVADRGLIRFGQPGEPFDPELHDALSHLGSEEGLDVTTIKVVAKAGYRIGARVVRAAQVLVVDPA